jgi:hypothetical protein
MNGATGQANELERFQNTHTHTRERSAKHVASLRAREHRTRVWVRFNWHERGAQSSLDPSCSSPNARASERAARVYFDSQPRRDQPAVSQLAELISASSLAPLSRNYSAAGVEKSRLHVTFSGRSDPAAARCDTLHDRGRFTLSRLKNVRWLLLTFSVKLSGDVVIYLHYAYWLKKQFQLTLFFFIKKLAPAKFII